MISGAHVVLYSKDAEADRVFFRDVLGFSAVDAGDGWLIFALPPAEAAIHPSDRNGAQEFYFMCDDLQKRWQNSPRRASSALSYSRHGGGRSPNCRCRAGAR